MPSAGFGNARGGGGVSSMTARQDRLRDFKHRAEYILIRIGSLALRALPLDVARPLLGRLFSLVAPWTKLHRRAAANIAAALPELAAAEHRRILSLMWRNTGAVVAEMAMVDRTLADPHRLEIIGDGPLRQRLKEPGSQIGVTFHFGNWELAGWAAEQCGCKLAAIYRPLRNPYLDRYLYSIREGLYPRGLLFKGRDSTARQLVSYFRKGPIGLVCDQSDETAEFTVPFFAHAAKFTPAPALLARRLDASVWLMRCSRVGHSGRFCFELKELCIPRTDSADEDVRAATAAMARQFEAWIRETPEQWMWWQRRSIGSPLGT